MRNYKYKGIKISKKSTILEIYKKEIITIFATVTIMVATYLWYYFNLELITVSKLILFYVICLLSITVIYDITCYFISLYKALYLPINDHECDQLNINNIDEYAKFVQKFLFGYRPVLKIRKKIGYFLYNKYGYNALMKTDIFLLRRGNGLTLKFMLLDTVILLKLFLYGYDIKKLLFISIGIILGIIIFTYKKYSSSFTDYCIFIEWIESVFDVKVVNKNGLYSINGLDIECKSLQKLYRILLLRKDIGRRIPNVEEKKVQEVFYAPIKGKVKEITETPDHTFAKK